MKYVVDGVISLRESAEITMADPMIYILLKPADSVPRKIRFGPRHREIGSRPRKWQPSTAEFPFGGASARAAVEPTSALLSPRARVLSGIKYVFDRGAVEKTAIPVNGTRRARCITTAPRSPAVDFASQCSRGCRKNGCSSSGHVRVAMDSRMKN